MFCHNLFLSDVISEFQSKMDQNYFRKKVAEKSCWFTHLLKFHSVFISGTLTSKLPSVKKAA